MNRGGAILHTPLNKKWVVAGTVAIYVSSVVASIIFLPGILSLLLSTLTGLLFAQMFLGVLDKKEVNFYTLLVGGERAIRGVVRYISHIVKSSPLIPLTVAAILFNKYFLRSVLNPSSMGVSTSRAEQIYSDIEYGVIILVLISFVCIGIISVRYLQRMSMYDTDHLNATLESIVSVGVVPTYKHEKGHNMLQVDKLMDDLASNPHENAPALYLELQEYYEAYASLECRLFGPRDTILGEIFAKPNRTNEVK